MVTALQTASGQQVTDGNAMDILLNFRPATLADASLLLAWRNDPLTRAQSHQSAAIDPEAHQAWLRQSLNNPQRQLLIAYLNDQAIGTVRVDQAADGALLSWTIAPSARGKGLGKLMVKQLAAQLSGVLRAEIKADNQQSVRIAEYAGLQFERELDGVMYFLRPALQV